MKIVGKITERCWKGYEPTPGKEAYSDGSCRPVKRKKKKIKEDAKPGLWANIRAKRKRGEKASKPGEKGYPKTLNIEGKSPAWQRKAGKNPEGGLNKKGVASYRAANPGSKLKTAVTKDPSKLKKGSKAAGRRKSFCARMSGMKKRNTSKKTANDPDSRINKSLRKWNC